MSSDVKESTVATQKKSKKMESINLRLDRKLAEDLALDLRLFLQSEHDRVIIKTYSYAEGADGWDA